MPRRLVIATGVLAVVLLAVLAAWWMTRAPLVPAVSAGTVPLVRTLQFSARVATASRVELGSTLTGRVLAVAVAEGAQVKAGDLLERMTAGSCRIDGVEMSGLDDAALTLRRRSSLGFIFQFHHLLPAFSALENVTLPALMREGRITPAQRERARAVLAAVGLGDAMGKRPGELSGVMQQRVAIARALVLEPPLVLADEPTGNLDTVSADEVFALMRQPSESPRWPHFGHSGDSRGPCGETCSMIPRTWPGDFHPLFTGGVRVT